MKILITGGAGFIGSNLSLHLKKKHPNYSIIAFDNLKRRGSELNLPALKDNGIEFIHGDTRNPEDFSPLIPFDVLVEASGDPSVMTGLDNTPSYIINNNLNGSINCFNACLKSHAKLIFLSTSRVYPINIIEAADFIEEETRFTFSKSQKQVGISTLGISEKLSLDGARSFYGATKLSAELFIKEYTTFYSLKAAITRFGVVAGPKQMGKSSQGLATLWMARHYWKQPLKYIGYGGLGKQVRDVLHIDDLVQLIDLQIHHTHQFEGKVYNAGGGLYNSASLLEMTKICENITGNQIPIDAELQKKPADIRLYVSNNSMITHDTGLHPKHPIEKTFADIFSWIHQNEHSLKRILI